jgi:hypothetical protein
MLVNVYKQYYHLLTHLDESISNAFNATCGVVLIVPQTHAGDQLFQTGEQISETLIEKLHQWTCGFIQRLLECGLMYIFILHFVI